MLDFHESTMWSRPFSPLFLEPTIFSQPVDSPTATSDTDSDEALAGTSAAHAPAPGPTDPPPALVAGDEGSGAESGAVVVAEAEGGVPRSDVASQPDSGALAAAVLAQCVVCVGLTSGAAGCVIIIVISLCGSMANRAPGQWSRHSHLRRLQRIHCGSCLWRRAAQRRNVLCLWTPLHLV